VNIRKGNLTNADCKFHLGRHASRMRSELDITAATGVGRLGAAAAVCRSAGGWAGD